MSWWKFDLDMIRRGIAAHEQATGEVIPLTALAEKRTQNALWFAGYDSMAAQVGMARYGETVTEALGHFDSSIGFHEQCAHQALVAGDVAELKEQDVRTTLLTSARQVFLQNVARQRRAHA